MKDSDIGPPLHSLVIPGKLHFIEIEMLKGFTERQDLFVGLEEHNERT